MCNANCAPIVADANCAPIVADLFLFCYERAFMLSLSDNNQADVIQAFIYISRYLQLLSKIFIGSDFCHNYLHTLYLFTCLL